MSDGLIDPLSLKMIFGSINSLYDIYFFYPGYDGDQVQTFIYNCNSKHNITTTLAV